MTDRKSALRGVNVMLLGPTGTGKTTAIKTLINCGITPMCVFTEPGEEVLGDIPAEKLHWKYVSPMADSLDMILDRATKVASMTYKAMLDLQDFNRNRDNRFIEIVKTFNNFVCDRDGKSYGAATDWGTDKALVCDSLTGLGLAVMSMVVGSRPAKDQKDWLLAQDQLEGVVSWACTATRCHFVLIAHAEREVDEVLGGSQIMASTLGKKLAPKLPRFFSDVILTQRIGKNYRWSTAAVGADLKARNLPTADDLQPDFKQIIDTWKSRGGVIEP